MAGYAKSTMSHCGLVEDSAVVTPNLLMMMMMMMMMIDVLWSLLCTW